MALVIFAAPKTKTEIKTKEGAIRVLFLGHESEHHNSNKYYPMLAEGLGRDAIYFDYVTSVEEALGDATFLGKFDALYLCESWNNHSHSVEEPKDYVEGGGGFVPVHCASWVSATNQLSTSWWAVDLIVIRLAPLRLKSSIINTPR